MTNDAIEAVAYELQRKLWRAQHTLWPEGPPSLIDMLDPSVAARMLGVEYEVYEELGSAFPYRGARHETAGLIDRQAKKIAISRRFSRVSLRFTGAHELGHWLLHPGEIMHRDRPVAFGTVDGASLPKEELEANHFAACFLMPRRLLQRTLVQTFGVNIPLVIDDDAAFRLCPQDPDSVLRADQDSLEFHVTLASTRRYGTRVFNSLAAQFDVAAITMARRLQQLQIIR